MSPNQPVLYLFKPGYEPQQAELKYHDTAYLNDPWSTGDPVRAVANDRTIELRRWNKSDAAYNQRLIFWNAGFLNSCGWARTPRMTVALIREGERLKGLNPSKRNEVLDPQWLKGDRLGQHCVSNEAMQAILDEALK
jgi:hypothetical protein